MDCSEGETNDTFRLHGEHPGGEKTRERTRQMPAHRVGESPDELIDVICAKTHRLVVTAAEIDAGEDIVVTHGLAVRVDVDHGAVHLEEGDHFFNIIIDHQGVG